VAQIALGQESSPRAARQRRWARIRRIALIGSGVGFASILLVWFAIHRFEWAGPLVANTLRAIIGTNNVAKLEDFVYGIEDRVNRLFKKNEPPKAYWKVPAAPPSASAAAPSGDAGAGRLPAFAPKNPGPALKKGWSAAGDGEWVPMRDPRRPSEEPYMYKTLLHPDSNRSWSEVFVVAIDLRRARVYPVAGSQEPKADTPEGEKFERTGKIPPDHHEELLGAFNGGFMTEHGGYGMKLDGITIVKPKPNACTIAMYNDDSVRIATWSKLVDTEPQMRWYRQAPACMWEDDKLHPGLQDGKGLKWGATLDGETVIRRSAIGISADRNILYVSITNHTSARVLADGVHHAGAATVAQLDVNWSYPKFVTFEPGDAGPARVAVALAEGFEFSPDQFIRKKDRRDFFYLMRKDTGLPPPKGFVEPPPAQ
jgi:hypothetical protein